MSVDREELQRHLAGGLDPTFPYGAGSVLTIEQVADWLQVSKRHAERLHIPCLYLGTRTRRYLGKTVLAYLEKREQRREFVA